MRVVDPDASVVSALKGAFRLEILRKTCDNIVKIAGGALLLALD